jgi:N6-L-threonylcarbamoyladenine synthase
MPLSLDIGLSKGKKMAREHGLPFIPIHHMEAHALMVRMTEPVSLKNCFKIVTETEKIF